MKKLAIIMLTFIMVISGIHFVPLKEMKCWRAALMQTV